METLQSWNAGWCRLDQPPDQPTPARCKSRGSRRPAISFRRVFRRGDPGHLQARKSIPFASGVEKLWALESLPSPFRSGGLEDQLGIAIRFSVRLM